MSPAITEPTTLPDKMTREGWIVTEAVTPAAMEGKGRYNRSSQVQAAGLSPAVPMLERAAREVLLPGERLPIVIADYGSSQGHNSLAPVGAAIDVLRERAGRERAISVVHVDLPGNDFTALFETLLSDPQSYLKRDAAAFASAVGRSFYEQVLPAETVTLGWSSWAVQWLSQAPGVIPDQVQVALSSDAEAKKAFHRQAAEDWRQFLAARGRELCEGGRLVVLTMAADERGEFGYRALLQAIYGSLVKMVNSSFLTEEELRQMSIPTVGRSREEFLTPFGVGGSFAGLRLEEMEVFLGEDHIWADYQRDRDPRSFGARWAAFSRASVFPTLAEALKSDGDTERSAAFIAQLESMTAAHLAERPERMLIPLARIRLAKHG
jgi:SAM dependent carboxyl methyltransferase